MLLFGFERVLLAIAWSEAARDHGDVVAFGVPGFFLFCLARVQHVHFLVAAAPGAEDFGEGVGGRDEDEREGEEFHALGELGDLDLDVGGG